MKKKQKIAIVIAIIILVISLGVYYLMRSTSDKCTNKDREINNCVPAGKCGPTPAIDTAIDCDVKSYDKKYNTEL